MRLISVIIVDDTHSHLDIRTLHGSLSQDGFCLRVVSGSTFEPVRLEKLLVDKAIILGVGLNGETSLHFGGKKLNLATGQAFVFAPWVGLEWRATGDQRLLILEVKVDLLRQIGRGATLRDGMTALEEGEVKPFVSVLQAPLPLMSLAEQLPNPPGHAACLPVWFQAKVLELMSLVIFSPGGSVNLVVESEGTQKEQVDKALFILQRDLENPPTLEALANEVGCGPFALSRLISQHTGKSIPELLREHRMNRAAHHLLSSRASISEIALMVGYTSFSAFTRAFVREFTATPSEYRKQRQAAR